MREDTKVVVDDTTIYEIDLNCYHCLSEQERQAYFPRAAWEQGTKYPDLHIGEKQTQQKR